MYKLFILQLFSPNIIGEQNMPLKLILDFWYLFLQDTK